MIQLLRLLKGYVLFCAEGGFPERFINLCKINGINLWDVKNDGVKVYACTTNEEFELLSVPAENSGMTINIIKIRGLKEFTKRHKWRSGAAFGVIVVILFWIFMSGFVWEIEIVENGAVNVEDFTQSLENLGVKIGARKSKIDIINVQNKLLNEYQELLWVSVNIFGGKVQVEMSGFVEQQEIIDTQTPVNLVSSKKGKITLVKGYYGISVVTQGDNVTEGSLLISGVGVNGDGSEYFVHAKGEVYAKTKNTVVKRREYERLGKVVYETQNRFGLYVFSFNIPFGFQPKGQFITENTVFIESGNAVLPLGVVREDNFSAKEKALSYNENEGMLECLFEAVEDKRKDYNDTDLIKVEYIYENIGKASEVTLRIDCVENIAEESRIFLDD